MKLSDIKQINEELTTGEAVPKTFKQYVNIVLSLVNNKPKNTGENIVGGMSEFRIFSNFLKDRYNKAGLVPNEAAIEWDTWISQKTG